MRLFDFFAEALPLSEFLSQYGTPAHRERWQRTRSLVTLTEAQKQLLTSFRRETNLLMLAGAWCGDCAGQCPILECFAEVAPVLRIRYLDRDAYPQVQQELQINGGNRVPVCVFFSEDGYEVARYGERTLSRYRQLVREQLGEGCATGLVKPGDEVFAAVVQDWLNEVERVQWILRLSPRLRQKHGD